MAIKGVERRAGADDAEVDRHASGPAEIILRGVHQFAAEACALARGIHAKQAEVTTIAAKLNVDATSQAGRIFGEEEFPFCHVGANAWRVDAIAFDILHLDAETAVNQMHEGFENAKICGAEPQCI